MAMNKLDTRRMFVRGPAWRTAPIVLLIAVTLVGCGGGVTESVPTATQPIPTPTFVPPTPAFTVGETKDVQYTAPLQAGVPAQKLDVYAPTEPGPWPVLILLHGFGTTKDVLVNASFGEELAGRGQWYSSPTGARI